MSYECFHLDSKNYNKNQYLMNIMVYWRIIFLYIHVVNTHSLLICSMCDVDTLLSLFGFIVNYD